MCQIKQTSYEAFIMEHHEKIDNGERSNNDACEYLCNFTNCSRSYKNQKELQVHVGSHYLKCASKCCKICDVTMQPPSYKVFRLHQVKVHKNSAYTCPLSNVGLHCCNYVTTVGNCEFSSGILKTLKYHMFQQHREGTCLGGKFIQ